MAIYNEIKRTKTFMGKLKFGGDLLEELTSICEEKDICLGSTEALGAVQKARFGFYDQKARKYDFIEIDKPLEITKLIGNISLRDGKPMVHAHITLSDSQGNAFGGHLAPGTIVFACEFIINSYDGPDHIRDYDEQTGLPLWKI
ncbi:MAG TPA: PPC domain-containing DNA-binding protein [Sedimentisphaerales bacterium]|nr:PPC domain-containing DNA-binding protein [Sedimentisphaerales bacterium]